VKEIVFGARVALEFGDISKVPTHRARCRRRARRDGATATRAGSRGVRLEGRARRAQPTRRDALDEDETGARTVWAGKNAGDDYRVDSSGVNKTSDADARVIDRSRRLNIA